MSPDPQPTAAQPDLHTEVLVVGGGPAGCTAAITLAQQGHQVVLVEKTPFPRYHVGESLLPHCWFTLDRLGVLPAVQAAGFQVKRSVQFVSPDGRLSAPFYFHQHDTHPSAHTWQVDRAQFDSVLLDRCRDVGVTVLEETRAVRLLHTPSGTIAGATVRTMQGAQELPEQAIHATLLVDCSGRQGFVRGQLGWSQPEPALQRVALWTYFEGAVRDEGDNEGATTVAKLPGDGWFWWIPLANGKVSVGVVTQREQLFAVSKDRATAFEHMVHANPWIAKRLQHARPAGPHRITSDYAYRSSHCATDGAVLAGDAFAFLDPVFSSGVFLALATGERAALAAHEALTAGRTDAAAFDAYGRWVCKGVEAMRALVFSFYDPSFSMARLLKAHPHVRGDVTDLLIGDLFRDYDALYAALADLGTLPPTLAYGLPTPAAASAAEVRQPA